MTRKERKTLRGLSHILQPVVHVGKGGITEAVVAAVDTALDDHELIKVKLMLGREARKEAAVLLADGTGAVLADQIGNIAILYREHSDPEQRLIDLSSPTGLSF